MDKQAIIKALRDTAQSASNSVAETASAPIDAITWALRKAGLPVPENAVGSSDWMAQKGLTAPVDAGIPKMAGEVLGNVVPAIGFAKAPQIARGMNRMVDNAMAPATMNKQSGKVFVYPQDEALATAQRNAAKPVSEGGLGLRPDNTAMERAQAMGYNTPAYHGTSADFSEFSVAGKGKTSGSGAFFTDNPSVASTYASPDGGSVLPTMLQTETPVQVAANGANWNWLGKGVKVDAPKTAENKAAKKTLGKLFPDVFKYEDSLSTDDLARWANNQGYDSVIFDAVKDRGPNGVFSTAEAALPSKNTAMFNPANIRSRFAAFDPARRNEADLLGRADPALLGLIGLGTGAGVYGANK